MAAPVLSAPNIASPVIRMALATIVFLLRLSIRGHVHYAHFLASHARLQRLLAQHVHSVIIYQQQELAVNVLDVRYAIHRMALACLAQKVSICKVHPILA